MKFTKEILSQQVYPICLIPTGNGWTSTENQELSVLETGPKGKLLEKMVAAVYQAEEMVCLQSFLMQDNKLFRALVEMVDQKGIKVFVMGSAEARLVDNHEEAEDFRKAAYIELLEQQFKGRFVFRQAANLHGKYILIDPKGTDAKGFICTNNFNLDPFFKNPELGIELSPLQIAELFQVFIYHFWEATTDMQTERKDFDRVQPENQYAFPKLKSILVTTPLFGHSNLGASLLKMVEEAKKSIELSSFSFEPGQPLAKLLIEKAKKGVEVTVFSPPRAKNIESFLRELKKAGGKVYLNDRLHAKFLLVDRAKGSIFTANIAAQGLDTGMEVGILLRSEQVQDLVKIVDLWKKDFRLVLDVAQSIQKAPMEFCIIKNGKVETVKIQAVEQKKISKKIVNLKELRQAMMDFGKIEVPENVQKLDCILELISAPLPDGVNTIEKVNAFISIIDWKEEKKQKQGILLQKGYDPNSLNSISADNNHLPVFFKD